jgi:hypothetical protein
MVSKGLLDSDFKYDKLQLYYNHNYMARPRRRTNIIMEVGKLWNRSFGTHECDPGKSNFSYLKIPLATLISMNLLQTSMLLCSGITIST